MRRFSRLLFVFLATLLLASSAFATSFIVPTDRQMVAKSSAIAIGTVEGSYVRQFDPDGDLPVETVFEIRLERGLKNGGKAGDLISVVTPGGHIDGRTLYVPGAPQFVLGQRVLLFLTRHKNHWETTDLMLGKFRFATTMRGDHVVVRDDDADVDTDAPRPEAMRSEAGFLRFIEGTVRGAAPAESYTLPPTTLSVSSQAQTSRAIVADIAPFAPESYTQKFGTQGSKWSPTVAATALNFFRRTGCGAPSCDIGSPDQGIVNGMAAWDNECSSIMMMVLAGTTSTPAGAIDNPVTGPCTICDQKNVIEFNDPQNKIAGSWTGAGTIAVTTITVADDVPTVGANFLKILDADIVFQNGYNPSTEVSYPVAVTHELGHAIGFRHSNASPASPNDSANTCNPATEECQTTGQAIMYWLVNSALGSTLQTWDIHAIQAVYPGPAGACSKYTGIFRPSNAAFFLKNANNTGFADTVITFGNPTDLSVTGDWNNDGIDTVGIFRNGTFFLKNTNVTGFSDISFFLGGPGDLPVAGDWNGDGITTVGVFRNGTFFLRNSNSGGPPDAIFNLGQAGDLPIAGDWNGDGIDTVGVYRPSTGQFFLKNTNSTGFADIAFVYGGNPGDLPVTGDWNGDGKTTIGLYRTGSFLLRNSNTSGIADVVFNLGNPGDTPVSGNWIGH